MGVESFIDVRHVFVEYEETASMLSRLSGRKRTTHSVLRNVSFSLRLGEHATVYGQPGAGKTTLLRLLAGALAPSKGDVSINGGKPATQKQLAVGYVSVEESEPQRETVSEILHAFGRTHGITTLPARIGAVAEVLEMGSMMHRPAGSLSTSEQLIVNIAKAAISDTPVVLLDDVADQLGVAFTLAALGRLFAGRTALVATRFTKTAEDLQLPVMLLHHGQLAHFGTCDDIGTSVGCRRLVDVWIEGLRYDLLRNLRRHPGIEEVQLVPTDQFDGQRLRVTLTSSRYLPQLYDLVSQADLVRVEEVPVKLSDILQKI